MGLPTSEHIIFIPAVLLVGIIIGWKLGAKATRDKLEEQAKRARE
jgi:hypothetical protein